jgi:LytS/YehU family sensor histidine kinase
VAPLLDDLCSTLGPALSARRVTWREWPQAATDDHRTVVTQGDQTLALVRPTDPPRYAMCIGEVTGGRRFFSDDLATLEAVSVLAARRIDAIRITRERYDRSIRDQETEKLATEAELRTLRAQLNPHFLFNALTTIGYLIQAAPTRALSTLMRLTSLLRAVLRSDGDAIALRRELDVVEAYLEIECARFEQRLRFTIDVPAALVNLPVPPLILQPLVENAVKHGISKQRRGGDVRVSGRLERDGRGERLVLSVEDTGAGATPEDLERGREDGVGLRNLERRLECLYGSAASVGVRSTPDSGTIVEVRLPAARRRGSAPVLEQAAR